MSRPRALVWMAFAAAPLVACGASPREGGFDAAVPGARLEAIEDAVQRHRAAPDRQLEPATLFGLVESLRSDDDLVRFAAIGALQELTGTTRGYRHDDPPALRDLAVEEWVRWARGGDTT